MTASATGPLPTPRLRIDANVQPSTTKAAPTTAHTGSDTVPVQLEAATHSSMRSNMTHHHVGSMAHGRRDDHPSPGHPSPGLWARAPATNAETGPLNTGIAANSRAHQGPSR